MKKGDFREMMEKVKYFFIDKVAVKTSLDSAMTSSGSDSIDLI